MTMIICTSAVYCLLLLGLLYAARRQSGHYLTVKMICSTAFVLLGILYAAVPGNLAYLPWMLPALILCFLGDFLIGLFRKSHRSRHFMLGLCFFLAAHVGFSAFLLKLHPGIHLWNVLIPVLVCGIFLVVERGCHLNMKKMKLPAMVYALFLSFFMIKALEFAGGNLGTGAGWIGLGALLFFASDVSIIFLYFRSFRSQRTKTGVHVFNLVTYYLVIIALEIGLYCL